MTVMSSRKRGAANLLAWLLLIFTVSGSIAASWRMLVHQTATLAYLQVLVGVISIVIVLFAIEVRTEWRQILWDRLKSQRLWQIGVFAVGVVFWLMFLLVQPFSHQIELCTSAQNFGAQAEVESYLLANAAQSAAAFFGSDASQVQVIGVPEFYNDSDLGQICIRANFVSR